VIIKVLFTVMLLSLLALLGVAIAVFVRVWKHLKGRTRPTAEPETATPAPPEKT
jgi:hypothetical protein